MGLFSMIVNNFLIIHEHFLSVYTYTYIVYDISVSVTICVFKEGRVMKSDDILNTLLSQGNGVFLASEATELGLSRTQLSRMVKSGMLERSDYGVYIKAGEMDDELYSLQKRAKKIIYSHETALFLHRLTERTPFIYSITVPSGYKPSENIKDKCKVYYIKQDLIEVGKIEIPSGFGHQITSYDMERTICDVIRSRNKIDSQIVIDALKFYSVRKDADLNKLFHYAKQFRIDKLLYQYTEVLL